MNSHILWFQKALSRKFNVLSQLAMSFHHKLKTYLAEETQARYVMACTVFFSEREIKDCKTVNFESLYIFIDIFAKRIFMRGTFNAITFISV